MVEENTLQASLFGGGSSSVGGEDDAVNQLMELADQDDVDIPMPNIPPLCQCLFTQTQNNTGNKGVEKVTTREMTNIPAGLRRAKDLMKTQKTKNLLNKNKECTLIAGTSVKLVERQGLGGMAANMSMMLMRQREEMNSSMDKRDQ
jgi:hypothetical protein